MSFIHIKYKDTDRDAGEEIYTLKDSEFGEIEVMGVVAGVAVLEIAIAVVKEYSKRGLDVGKNLALATIWHSKDRMNKVSINEIVAWQDEDCPAFIENWQQYAKERDEHLAKLVVLI